MWGTQLLGLLALAFSGFSRQLGTLQHPQWVCPARISHDGIGSHTVHVSRLHLGQVNPAPEATASLAHSVTVWHLQDAGICCISQQRVPSVVLLLQVMLCIEPAVAGSGPVKLAPGASWSGSQTLVKS